MTRKYRDLQERLFANTEIVHTGYKIDGEPSACWAWIGNLDYKSYGRITLRVNGKHRKRRAHRVSYEVFFGVQLTDEDEINHECHFRACIHPNHLRPVNTGENARDRSLRRTLPEMWA